MPYDNVDAFTDIQELKAVLFSLIKELQDKNVISKEAEKSNKK